MTIAAIIILAVIYLAGLCWTAWRDHLEHLQWLRRRRLMAMASKMASGAIAAMAPALAAFGIAAVEAARAWEQAFQRIHAHMVSAAEVIARMVPPCIECDGWHPNQAFTGPCTYGVDGCVESAGCGSIIVMHTVDHTADVGPSETLHDADRFVVAVDPAMATDMPAMPVWSVWAEIDYDERVNTSDWMWPSQPAASGAGVPDDWGSRLQEPHIDRDGASGMTLDELLADIDTVIGEGP